MFFVVFYYYFFHSFPFLACLFRTVVVLAQTDYYFPARQNVRLVVVC